MSKKDKKMGANKASILKASLPAHLANRIVNIKVKKPKKKDWMAFVHTPDPERPVQFVGPKELVEASRDVQMGWGKTATIPLVEPTKKYLEVWEAGFDTDRPSSAEFEVMPDGSLNVAVTNRTWGGQFADINLTPEQFAAFKQWVLEN